MNNETDNKLHSFAGKIICVSDESGRMEANIEHTSYLRTDEVKAKAIETYSESDVRHIVEEIPQLYNFKSTVFTDWGK